MMIKNNINHVVFILDASGSMAPHASNVIRVFDAQIKRLAERSREMDQETRVSVYTFAQRVECVIFDKDVLRLPSIVAHYRAAGGTALYAGVIKALDDLATTPEQYGDHAFLAYVLTDGQESGASYPLASDSLSSRLASLKDNWTIAALVPSAEDVFHCKRAGFSAENVSVWNANSAGGADEVGDTITRATDAYMTARATGVRSTKNLFALNTSKVTSSAVKTQLSELRPSDYALLNVRQSKQKQEIKPFVESWKIGEYRIGSAYYQLTKPERVQSHKQICIQHKLSGKVYGGSNARKMLGLPDCEVRVSPAQHPDFDLFIQSTSVNRHLVPGTKVLVML